MVQFEEYCNNTPALYFLQCSRKVRKVVNTQPITYVQLFNLDKQLTLIYALGVNSGIRALGCLICLTHVTWISGK